MLRANSPNGNSCFRFDRYFIRASIRILSARWTARRNTLLINAALSANVFPGPFVPYQFFVLFCTIHHDFPSHACLSYWFDVRTDHSRHRPPHPTPVFGFCFNFLPQHGEIIRRRKTKKSVSIDALGYHGQNSFTQTFCRQSAPLKVVLQSQIPCLSWKQTWRIKLIVMMKSNEKSGGWKQEVRWKLTLPFFAFFNLRDSALNLMDCRICLCCKVPLSTVFLLNLLLPFGWIFQKWQQIISGGGGYEQSNHIATGGLSQRWLLRESEASGRRCCFLWEVGRESKKQNATCSEPGNVLTCRARPLQHTHAAPIDECSTFRLNHWAATAGV